MGDRPVEGPWMLAVGLPGCLQEVTPMATPKALGPPLLNGRRLDPHLQGGGPPAHQGASAAGDSLGTRVLFPEDELDWFVDWLADTSR
jgi:hypothetical protein